ncbi:beta-1,3-galactosyltransferase 5-like [Haliotis rufescens]|uniref:beta-1,3-galactosyltransferase 5-like n=1 Tax=Haliotis rufescens TaxID=6454 RepID=UPI00201EE5E5|nr:beta-1,3-galactosyltransferase 5-like [Haliotis rufescens]XP_046358135.2 beta-1,3-galactosyltransferase 5-like [Haliotis rufescens]
MNRRTINMFQKFLLRRWHMFFWMITATSVFFWVILLAIRRHETQVVLNNGLYGRKLRDEGHQPGNPHLKKPLMKMENSELHKTIMNASKLLTNQRFENLPMDKIGLIYKDILNWSHIVSDDELDPLLNRHHFAYHLTTSTCRDGSPDILIFVHSGCDHFAKRQLVRKTWGSVKTVRGLSFRTVFMLGETSNQTLQKVLETESLLRGDIVQGNFADTYKNLTYKHIMSLGWILKECPGIKLIVKLDDDTMLNTYNLVDYFHLPGAKDRLLYCSVYYRQGPLRHNRTKWYVSPSEYPFQKFPNYCEGFGYVMSPDVARSLYKASEDARYFWVDDVYVTGILTLKVGLTLSDFISGFSYKRDATSNMNIKRAMFMSGVRNWESMWNDIFPNVTSV